MKYIKILITLGLLVAFFSCSKEKSKNQSIPNRNSIIYENGQISKNLANDSSFVKFDEANYEMNMDFIKHSGANVNRVKSEKVNDDLRKKKFKNFKEFAIEKEKIGYENYLNRRRVLFNFLKTKKDLFNKYPELINIKESVFLAFYNQNKKHKISLKDFYNHLQISKEERKEIKSSANKDVFSKYKKDMLEALNLATFSMLKISSQTKFSKNSIIYDNIGFEDSNSIEDFLKFEKFADSMTFALSGAIEAHKKSFFNFQIKEFITSKKTK